jgi:hypothetical protein
MWRVKTDCACEWTVTIGMIATMVSKNRPILRTMISPDEPGCLRGDVRFEWKGTSGLFVHVE